VKKNDLITKMKRTGPTNPELQSLITELKKRGSEQNASLWQRIASDLERPTRQRRVVNLSKISRYAEDNDVVVIPGKVLGAGSLNRKVTISAYQFSTGAREKIEQAGSKTVSLLELSQSAPKGKNIKILG
jgi:large subunit ribosomal protein L18e